MKQFGIGPHLTKAGYPATVVRITSGANGWQLKGHVECPETKALVIMTWDLYGRCLDLSPTQNHCDLAERVGDLRKKENETI